MRIFTQRLSELNSGILTPVHPLLIIWLFFQISRLTVISLHSLDSRSSSRVPASGQSFPQRLSRDVGEVQGREPGLCLSQNESPKPGAMVEAGTLACESPPCLLHTCLLCSQPRTQLSQPRATYPRMNGSAAFPTLVTLVARAFATGGSKRRCESIPGVHPIVCHTQPWFGETAYFQEVAGGSLLEEAVGTNVRFLPNSLNTC